MLIFQQIILRLQNYWDAQGCALLQPYDMEVSACTFHTATLLRSIGPEPWRAAHVQPSRRPKDSREAYPPCRPRSGCKRGAQRCISAPARAEQRSARLHAPNCDQRACARRGSVNAATR